jgi:hypothetical protein
VGDAADERLPGERGVVKGGLADRACSAKDGAFRRTSSKNGGPPTERTIAERFRCGNARAFAEPAHRVREGAERGLVAEQRRRRDAAELAARGGDRGVLLVVEKLLSDAGAQL